MKPWPRLSRRRWLLASAGAVALPAWGQASPAVGGRPFRVGLAALGDFNTLDPARAITSAPVIAVSQVYERLCAYDERGLVVPSLAQRWSHDRKLTEWRFALQTGVRFHAAPGAVGRVANVDDVRSSLERALRIPGYPQSIIQDIIDGAADYAKGSSSQVRGLSTAGNELVVRLVSPFRFLPDRLAATFFSVLPAGTTPEATGLLPGTGPYTIEALDGGGRRVLLRRNDSYWRGHAAGTPQLLEMRAFDAAPVAIEELRNRGIDWLEMPFVGERALQEALEQRRDVTISEAQTTTIRFVALNFSKPPFSRHPRLALALNLATNREAIVRFFGGGTAVAGPLPGGPGLPFDPVAAANIVRGIPETDRSFSMLVDPSPEGRIVAQACQIQWRTVGIRVTLQPGLADWVDRVIAGDYESTSIYYGPFAPTPEQYLLMYESRSQPVPNFMRYSNPSFDDSFRDYLSIEDVTQSKSSLTTSINSLLKNPAVVWSVNVPQLVARPTAMRPFRPGFLPAFGGRI
jgi:ABC-type transport system substrate-binding protein